MIYCKNNRHSFFLKDPFKKDQGDYHIVKSYLNLVKHKLKLQP